MHTTNSGIGGVAEVVSREALHQQRGQRVNAMSSVVWRDIIKPTLVSWSVESEGDSSATRLRNVREAE